MCPEPTDERTAPDQSRRGPRGKRLVRRHFRHGDIEQREERLDRWGKDQGADENCDNPLEDSDANPEPREKRQPCHRS